ncbi:hypothetical protein [Roseateles sp. SL47]|uniref:hypothetical protein n=1 Tax=Roseateles sp. SL47 TaxID=2995138 RepID=UPI003B636E5D
MLTHPTRHLGVPGLRRLAPHSLFNRLLRRWSTRMIAAGIGCDADLTVTPSAPAPPASSPATPPASKDNR